MIDSKLLLDFIKSGHRSQNQSKNQFRFTRIKNGSIEYLTNTEMVELIHINYVKLLIYEALIPSDLLSSPELTTSNNYHGKLFDTIGNYLIKQYKGKLEYKDSNYEYIYFYLNLIYKMAKEHFNIKSEFKNVTYILVGRQNQSRQKSKNEKVCNTFAKYYFDDPKKLAFSREEIIKNIVNDFEESNKQVNIYALYALDGMGKTEVINRLVKFQNNWHITLLNNISYGNIKTTLSSLSESFKFFDDKENVDALVIICDNFNHVSLPAQNEIINFLNTQVYEKKIIFIFTSPGYMQILDIVDIKKTKIKSIRMTSFSLKETESICKASGIKMHYYQFYKNTLGYPLFFEQSIANEIAYKTAEDFKNLYISFINPDNFERDIFLEMRSVFIKRIVSLSDLNIEAYQVYKFNNVLKKQGILQELTNFNSVNDKFSIQNITIGSSYISKFIRTIVMKSFPKDKLYLEIHKHINTLTDIFSTSCVASPFNNNIQNLCLILIEIYYLHLCLANDIKDLIAINQEIENLISLNSDPNLKNEYLSALKRDKEITEMMTDITLPH